MRYRKRPVVIDAVRYEDDTAGWQKVQVWLAQFGASGFVAQHFDGSLKIPTPEGTMTADVGDWIIRGVKGEVYPCKPDIFESTYEPVE